MSQHAGSSAVVRRSPATNVGLRRAVARCWVCRYRMVHSGSGFGHTVPRPSCSKHARGTSNSTPTIESPEGVTPSPPTFPMILSGLAHCGKGVGHGSPDRSSPEHPGSVRNRTSTYGVLLVMSRPNSDQPPDSRRPATRAVPRSVGRTSGRSSLTTSTLPASSPNQNAPITPTTSTTSATTPPVPRFERAFIARLTPAHPCEFRERASNTM